MDIKTLEVWFVTGSQHLYGEAALRQVAENSRCVVEGLNASGRLPVRVVFKPIVTTPQSILEVCREANAAAHCAGLILWMHTFSPAKMWIAGLTALQKPFVHLHTQFNRDLPWSTIDMDFMNLNQAAHGDREFGFICTRMGKPRKVVVGHWQDAEVQDRLAAWMRAAAGAQELRSLKVARLGDNMRQVAVTEGDKVEAQLRFGVEVNGYGVSELVRRITEVSDAEVDRLVAQYEQLYTLAPALRNGGDHRASLHYAARTELGLRHFLEAGGFKAFTDTFEDLHGLMQLPGLAVQRLMAEGYGFGAEGDWKTAALGRAMKVMAQGLAGGTSFMEDYTYHLDPAGPVVLGAHMLEICPSLAAEKPSCEIHPLGHRRQGRSRAAGFHRAGRRGGQCGDHRPGRPLPLALQRGRRRGPAATAAQAARGPGLLEAAARPEDGRCRLDLCRRSAPHGLEPGGDDRADRGFRRNPRHRVLED